MTGLKQTANAVNALAQNGDMENETHVEALHALNDHAESLIEEIEKPISEE